MAPIFYLNLSQVIIYISYDALFFVIIFSTSNIGTITMGGSARLLFLVKQKQGQSLWVNETNKKPGLANSIESLVSALVRYGVDAQIRDVADRNGIHAVVSQVKPTIVVIEAYWVTPGKLQLLKMLHPKVHWIVRNHSEVPFLAQEGNAGQWNCEYLKMGVEIASVSTRTVDDLMPLVYNLGVDPALLTYAPNIYLDDHVERRFAKPVPKDAIHIGCFGAVRTLKNHVQQAMAAIGYAGITGRKLYFHINGTRVEGNGSQPLRNLQGMFERLNNCELVEHPWMDKTQFYTLMKDRIDLVLQCSLTESFNIVAADAVLCSVPVIASPEIRWLDKTHHCDPNSAVDISKQIHQLFSHDDHFIQQYVDSQISCLRRYNRSAINTWLKRFK